MKTKTGSSPRIPSSQSNRIGFFYHFPPAPNLMPFSMKLSLPQMFFRYAFLTSGGRRVSADSAVTRHSVLLLWRGSESEFHGGICNLKKLEVKRKF